MSNIKFDFSKRQAIVTGGAQGIGLEIVTALLKAGAHVQVWDYSTKALDDIKKNLSEFSTKLSTQFIDVTDRSSCNQASASLKEPVDFLINNAGITRDKSFAKMNAEDWDAVINTNLSGLFNVTKSLFDKFSSQSTQKRIVNISSVVGLYGNFGQLNYAAAKAGVIGMTKTWGKELGRKGFTVNAVAPGFIMTAMTEAMPKEVLDQMVAKIPVNRMGRPADIAQTVLFLCSEEASYINGTVFSVDGGIVL
jgi:3-oxoacyl-[acyl-carrier protein] reductase